MNNKAYNLGVAMTTTQAIGAEAPRVQFHGVEMTEFLVVLDFILQKRSVGNAISVLTSGGKYATELRNCLGLGEVRSIDFINNFGTENLLPFLNAVTFLKRLIVGNIRRELPQTQKNIREILNVI